MLKIELESIFTPYTLDTYNTFTLDCDDQLVEDYNEQNGTDLSYDAFEFDYDIKGYLQALTANRLDLLRQNILDDVILAIDGDNVPQSPREYNYTTDKTWNEYSVDEKKLDAYILANQADYDENKIKSTDGFWWLGDEWQTKLHYYLATESVKKYPSNDYFMDQVDGVPEYEYTTIQLANA